MIKSGTRKARKDHRCEGFDQIDNGIGWHELTKFKGESLPPMPHAIRKGETYQFQISADGGEIFTWKSCQHCYDIIMKHELYDEVA